MKYLLILFITVSSLSFAQDETITIMSYNLLNFPNGRDDCGTNNIILPHREDTLKKIIDFIQPDILGTCEMQNQTGVDLVLNSALNSGANTNYAAANFVNSDFLNTALFYNTDKLVLKSQNIIQTSPRNITHYVLYLKDPQLSTYLDTTFIDVYMLHLKAGQGSQNESERAVQTQALMDYIATQPNNHNIFVCGDLNVYNSYDDGYVKMTSGVYALKDPINKPGNWHSNSSFSAYHTQATRTSDTFDCGVKGGLDDRFDQILVSQNVMNGTNHATYQNGSYKAIGNDGGHYNDALIDGNNSIYPEGLVNALYYMSDHLPVVLKVDLDYPSEGLALVPSFTNITCNGTNDGTATVTPQLGQAPYTYQWGTATGNQTGATATNLSDGTYCVTVTDALGTQSDYCFSITEPELLQYNTFTAPNTASQGCSGSIQILLGGGVQPYTFDWTDFPSEDTSALFNLCGGTYEIMVTDANGCTLNITSTVGGMANLITNTPHKLVTIFPNPANNDVFIRAQSTIKSLQLTTLNGKKINIDFQKISPHQYKLSAAQLTTQTYLLQLKLTNQTIIKRIIIQ